MSCIHTDYAFKLSANVNFLLCLSSGGTTTWATIVSIPKVNRQQPIQRVAGTSCDRKKHSIFPSVYGDKGNIILLSQAFDDTANIGQFRPPQGTELIAWINDIDEVSRNEYTVSYTTTKSQFDPFSYPISHRLDFCMESNLMNRV